MTSKKASGGLTLVAQIGLLMGPFLTMMDSNIVNVALPNIAQDLNGALSNVQWIVSAYLLALSTVLAASAYLAKRFGTVRIYLISLAGFTLGSALCAISPNLDFLIGARIVQGAFGAPLVPLAMGMLLGGNGSNAKGMSPVMGMLLFLAPAIGPTIGGILLQVAGWPTIFLINVPIGIAGFIAALRIPSSLHKKGDSSVRFDPIGLVMIAAGLALIVYAASNGPVAGWLSIGVWPYWALGGLLLIFYPFWGMRQAHPAIDLRLFRNRDTALAIGLCALTAILMFSIMVVVPVFMEDIQGYSPFVTGLALFPQGIVTGIGTILGTIFAKRYGVRWSAVVGLALLAIGTVILQWVGVDTPAWVTAFLMMFRGAAIGLVIQPLLLVVLQGLTPSENADANTLFNVANRLGGAVGIALLMTFFQERIHAHVSRIFGEQMQASDAHASVQQLSSLPSAIREQAEQAAVYGFHDTIWLLTGLSCLGLIAALFLRAQKNEKVVKKKESRVG